MNENVENNSLPIITLNDLTFSGQNHSNLLLNHPDGLDKHMYLTRACGFSHDVLAACKELYELPLLIKKIDADAVIMVAVLSSDIATHPDYYLNLAMQYLRIDFGDLSICSA